jgi:hypothetical protein
MEDGRYLIRADESEDLSPVAGGFSSSDAPAPLPPPPPVEKPERETAPVEWVGSPEKELQEDLRQIREKMHQSRAEDSLRWRALEARVAGLAKKLEQFSEQMAEVKMLVKIFEERLDGRL